MLKMKIKLFSRALKKGSKVLSMSGEWLTVEFVYPSRRLLSYMGGNVGLSPEQVKRVKHLKK